MAPKKSGSVGRKSIGSSFCASSPQQQQRSIASFFSGSSSPSPSPSPSPHNHENKPVLIVGRSISSPSPLAHPSATPPLCRKRKTECDYSPGIADEEGNENGDKEKHSTTELCHEDHEGDVTGYQASPTQCLHAIRYGDGDEELLDMSKEKYVLLPRVKRRRLRKLSSSGAHMPISLEASPSKGSVHTDDNLREKENDSGSSNPPLKTKDVNLDEKDVGTEKASAQVNSMTNENQCNSTEETITSRHGKEVAQSCMGNDRSYEHLTKPVVQPRKCLKSTPIAEKADDVMEKIPARLTNVHEECSIGVDEGLRVELTGAAAERFGHRSADKFKFLDSKRKDACGKQPGEPGYDPRTLHVPKEFLKGLPAGQRQWWEIKSKHMDKVLLFKMGKFYEMFEMDAHIGAQNLDLQYMKGDQPHCGFPEKKFEDYAGRLAQLGYRVLVIEQVETPRQLQERNMKFGTKDKVVRRDVCALITKGTITDMDMLGSTPDAAYLLAAFEISDIEILDGSSMIGLCFLDAATSRFIIGQFLDDMARSQLRSLLSELRPVELVMPRGLLSNATEKVLRAQTRNALVTILTPGSEFWDFKRTIEELRTLFQQNCHSKKGKNSKGMDVEAKRQTMPEFLKVLASSRSNQEAAVCALGGCISYLRQGLLDWRLLSIGQFEFLPGSQLPFGEITSANEVERQHTSKFLVEETEPFMVLDSSALENLDILENSFDGTTSGTLISRLDHCVTPFGRRLLKQWIVRPLLCQNSILDRQNAVEDIKGLVAEAVPRFRREFARLPDLERLVVRLHACNEKSGRDAQAVVLYEDVAKKLLKEFINALRGFQKIDQVLSLFTSTVGQFKSRRLQQLLTPGRGFPNLAPILQFFETAFDWCDAESSGRISPHEGVDPDFDNASASVSIIEQRLLDYLEEQREYLGNQNVTYATVGKDRYQIEVPDSLHKRVPSDYEAASQKKGFRRYTTLQVQELLRDLEIEEEKRESSLKNILQGLLNRFCESRPTWLHAIYTVAELDALISLVMATESFMGTSCKPIISTDHNISGVSSPFLFAKGLRHPILEGGLDGGGAFVPNDVSLGYKGQASFMLLTGPNMGGKSTLLRQVCLAVILAQIGAHVPAEFFELSPVDRIFVRMGAKDHIMAAQSTFLVELSETASMLTSATKNSLVALDELGRGTATSDGQAIAHAVLEHLAHEVGCRGMFSTHYHRIADDHVDDSVVALHHMACRVDAKDGVENVTFLYKLAHNACPKSYGVNVAHIAGMPESVLRRAASCAVEMEIRKSTHTFRASEKKLFLAVLRLVNEMSSHNCPANSVMERLCQEWRLASQQIKG